MAVGLTDCRFRPPEEGKKKGIKSAEQERCHRQQQKHFIQGALSLALMGSFLIPTSVALNLQPDIYGSICCERGSNV